MSEIESGNAMSFVPTIPDKESDEAAWQRMKEMAQILSLPENRYLKPTGGRVAVLRAPPKNYFGSGVSIMSGAADEQKDAPFEGWIIAKPDGHDRHEIMDFVMFSRWSGIDGPRVEDGLHVLMLEDLDDEKSDIWAVFDVPKFEALRKRMEDAAAEAQKATENAEAASEEELEKLRAELVAKRDSPTGVDDMGGEA